MTIIPEHPQRRTLNNEVHARPSVAIRPPLRFSYIVLFTNWPLRASDRTPIADLARRYGVQPPGAKDNHYTADFGAFSVTWERHTEFTRYLFSDHEVPETPFETNVIDKVPEDWLKGLEGSLIVANHGVLVEGKEDLDTEEISRRLFDGELLIGTEVIDGKALALTDFKIHGDGFGRFFIQDRGLSQWQAGRLIQRLLELDTYRVLSMKALPVARARTPLLRDHETELANITQAMLKVEDAETEHKLLDRLTTLQAAIENLNAGSHYRFSATSAYYALVQQRLDELREERIEGQQTFQEFIDRRLAPAVATCQSVSARQDSLSRRVARATQMLSTRVDVLNQRQNQAILNSMNRRAAIQLRQQMAIEALSVAAVAYYVVGLIGYGAKGLKASGVPVNPDLVVGIALPIMVIMVWRGLSMIRESFAEKDRDA